MESWLRPLYDAEGMRGVDRWAIEERGVASLELMEAAGRAVAEAVAGLAPEGPVRVVCGKGNNGGDGFVAARLLREMGFEVDVLLLWPGDGLRGDAAANFERSGGELVEGDFAAPLAGSGAIVDAIFGTGFEGAPREPADAAIRAIDGCGAPVVACDIASGVDASTGEVAGEAVQAESPSASTPPRSGSGSRLGSGTRASCGWRRSGSRPAPLTRRWPARSTRRSSTWPLAEVRTRPSSAPGRWPSPVARAG